MGVKRRSASGRKQKLIFAVTLIVLCAALAVTAGVYISKQHEYAVSTEYYSGLRMGQ